MPFRKMLFAIGFFDYLCAVYLVEHIKRNRLAVGDSSQSHYKAGVVGARAHFVLKVLPAFGEAFFERLQAHFYVCAVLLFLSPRVDGEFARVSPRAIPPPILDGQCSAVDCLADYEEPYGVVEAFVYDLRDVVDVSLCF